METLLVERAPNGVVTLTLNRPERKNAMNRPTPTPTITNPHFND